MTDRYYDPKLLAEIPPNVLKAATLVESYFFVKNIKSWKLGGIQNRVSEAPPLPTDGDGWQLAKSQFVELEKWLRNEAQDFERCGWPKKAAKLVNWADLLAAIAAPPSPNVLAVLERLLPQHKTDTMRGQIEAAIASLRQATHAAPPYYLLRSYRNWQLRFNHTVEVEIVLLDVANKRRAELTREECRDLAFKLAGAIRGTGK